VSEHGRMTWCVGGGGIEQARGGTEPKRCAGSEETVGTNPTLTPYEPCTTLYHSIYKMEVRVASLSGLWTRQAFRTRPSTQNNHGIKQLIKKWGVGILSFFCTTCHFPCQIILHISTDPTLALQIGKTLHVYLFTGYPDTLLS
jgi:hypothetical protein